MQGTWWYLVGDSPQGPVSIEALEDMLRRGEATLQSMVWREGLGDWISMARLLSLRNTDSVQPRPALPADPAPAMVTRRFLQRLAMWAWLLAMPPALRLMELLLQLEPASTPWPWYQRPSAYLCWTLAVLLMGAETGVWWFGPGRRPSGNPKMQGDWWLWIGGSPQGPVSAQALDAILRHGKMTQQSLVWSRGLTDWISVEQLADLRQAGALQMEPDSAFDPAPAGVWRRFLARMLDLCIISLPVTLLCWMLPGQMPGFALWLQRPSSPFLLTLCLLPLALLGEAGIFARFGNTPGKALLGVTVLTLDGRRPTAAQYLGRQWGVFCHGLALGLPLLSLIAMAAQGLGLQHGRPTPYDLNRFTVKARRLCHTEIRMLVLACIGCTMIGLSFALAYLGY